MSKSAEEMVAEIEDMERLWNDANLRRDVDFATSLLAPEFKLIIGVEGKSLQVLPRERWLSVLPHYVIQSYEIAEYSCELSVKMFSGQCRLIELEFLQGGPAGYGLRRQLIDRDKTPKGLLGRGERKSLQTNQVD